MAVMAAGMHAAGMARAMLELVPLVHRQAVHVGAQRHALRPGSLARDDADHAGLGKAGVRLDAPFPEVLGDQARRTALLERELGMGVDVAAQVAQLRVVAADPVGWGAQLGLRRSRGSTA